MRYFSTADSYISLSGAYGTAPAFLDINNPNDISPTDSKGITLSGQIPLNERFILTWRAAYLFEKFPNQINRNEMDIEAGFIWRF